MSDTARSEQVRTITRQKLYLNDYQWDLGSIFEEIEEGFEIADSSTRLMPYKNNIWNAITFELSTTRDEYTRTVYGFLDFLRDLGGLYGAIVPFFGVVLTMLQFRRMYMYLTTEMMADDWDKSPEERRILK